jgi:hypothetical protein
LRGIPSLPEHPLFSRNSRQLRIHESTSKKAFDVTVETPLWGCLSELEVLVERRGTQALLSLLV